MTEDCQTDVHCLKVWSDCLDGSFTVRLHSCDTEPFVGVLLNMFKQGLACICFGFHSVAITYLCVACSVDFRGVAIYAWTEMCYLDHIRTTVLVHHSQDLTPSRGMFGIQSTERF